MIKRLPVVFLMKEVTHVFILVCNQSLGINQVLLWYSDCGNPAYKITEEVITVDTDGEERDRRRKDMVLLVTGGGEAKNPENMESLY